MSYKVFYTKDFNSSLRALEKANKQSRDIVRKVRAAMTEAQMKGEIADLNRTHHGEDRLPNIEKYELGSGYRLVVQLVDGNTKARAFLFAGTHDDADSWLDNHQGYRWVENKSDKTLQFVQVTERKQEAYVPADRLDLVSPEALLELSLLRVITNEDWEKLKFTDNVKSYLLSISSLDYERDGDGILEHLYTLTTENIASICVDLLSHAQKREWDQLSQRIRLAQGEAFIPSDSETPASMEAPENSETIITFDDADLGEILEKSKLTDWMLFLHPEQKKVAYRDFSGPARLRGISGSGKTSVLVHRARYLAKKYNQPILVVTLTESMRKLLETLIRDLCGVEQNLIETYTVSQLAKNILEKLYPGGLRSFLLANSQQLRTTLERTVDHCRTLPEYSESLFSSWERERFLAFLREEISYIRSRLLPPEYFTYVDGKTFRRRGRGSALPEGGRRICFEGTLFWEDELKRLGIQDSEGIVAKATILLADDNHSFRRYRCAVSDEVQDLSQIDVTLLGGLKTPQNQRLSSAEDGLFLVGDGAQSIYRKGFTLRNAGIDIANRSFLLKKNYRNSYEILKAAYPLVEKYEFADLDEEDISRPTSPDFAKRRGEKPKLVKCSSTREEAILIADQIQVLLNSELPAGQICVIGPNPACRNAIQSALEEKHTGHVELREDIDFESNRVKISTIESAKGHEFAAVFIMGLVENVLPHTGATDEDLTREASRLYVAMTRAREVLWLLYSPTRFYGPSRFLLDIQAECDELAYNGTLAPLAM